MKCGKDLRIKASRQQLNKLSDLSKVLTDTVLCCLLSLFSCLLFTLLLLIIHTICANKSEAAVNITLGRTCHLVSPQCGHFWQGLLVPCSRQEPTHQWRDFIPSLLRMGRFRSRKYSQYFMDHNCSLHYKSRNQQTS